MYYATVSICDTEEDRGGGGGVLCKQIIMMVEEPGLGIAL